MAETTTDFAALLDRARQGDNEALAELARQYEPDVRIVARVLLGPALRPHLDTLDLVQSVHRSLLVGLRQNRYDLSSPQQLIALAAEMVRRKVGRKWRHLRRQQRLSGGPHGGDALAQQLAALPAGEAGPAETAQLNDALVNLCRNLPDQDRRLLELRLEGHSTAEAARILAADPDVLRVRLSRLRQALRASGLLADWI